MSYTQVHYSHTAPVNRLPTETLVDIFHMASVDRCRLPFSTDNVAGKDMLEILFSSHSKASEKLRTPTDRLAQVCSRWRKVAIALPSLWTHIDLTPDGSIGEGFTESASIYAQRASQLPLDIHIHDHGCSRTGSYSHLEDIIRSLASRTKSLHLVINTLKLLDFHSAIFDSLLPRISPKIFKNLRMSTKETLYIPLFEICDASWHSQQSEDSGDLDESEQTSVGLKRSEECQDDRFLGVTDVYLQGVFFEWNSKLYHGLVELRLTAPLIGSVPDMNTHELELILSESPRLRLLHFSIILYTGPQRREPKIIHHDLEVVHISTVSIYHGEDENVFHAESILQLIAPGSKPLRLTLEVGPDDPLFDSDLVKNFFSWSRVEKMCIKGGTPSLDQLRLCHLPELKTLVLNCCSRSLIRADKKMPLVLSSFFIRRVKMDVDALLSLAELCPSGLVLSDCIVHYGGQVMTENQRREAFPAVQFVDGRFCSDPTVGWDTLNWYGS